MNWLRPFTAAAWFGCCLLLAGCDDASHAQAPGASGNGASQAAAQGSDRTQRVAAAPPQRKSLTRYTTQPGWIEAYETAPLYSKVAGYVEKVNVDIGDTVTKGQTLVTLWVPELNDDVAQKEALVKQAEAEIKQAEAAVEAAAAALASAKARVQQAEAGRARAQADHQRWDSEYQRIKNLSASGSVTRKLADESLHQLQSAKAAQGEVEAQVLSAEAARDEFQALALKAQSDLRAAQAKAAVAQAELARAETMRQYLQIKAPFGGVVTERAVDTGHFVQPGTGAATTPLLRVVRSDVVRVFVDVPEIEAPLVTWGGEQADPVKVHIQSLNRDFEGTVTRTAWTLNPANRSLRTEIDLQNEEGLLRPGMYVTVKIRLDQKQDVLTLPATAILRGESGPYCCCVVDGKIAHRPVELGLRSGGDYEVLSGVDASDLVVTVRPELVAVNQQVEVIAPN